jgi:4-hydroxy-3-polyprenylbenzoate decarboxylase
VALKERRKLVICLRETPLSSIALENALKLSREGVILMPICPAFYMKPKTLDELTQGFVDKVIGVIGLERAPGWRSGDL